MKGDLLEAATRALKEESEAAADDGRFTRARVMASLHQGKVKRRTRLAFVLPLAACLAGGTAWGAVTGRLPAVFHALGQLVSYSPPAPSEPQHTAPRAKASAAPPPEVPAPPPQAAPVEAPQPAPPSAPAPSAKAAPEPAAASAAPATPATGSSAAFHDTDGDLYRLAHEAHFGAHDYARALAGWDAYLRAAPGGRLATEARYNRAICLLRLGRNAEARKALEPFASGLIGYRQHEARELLNELPP
jgi:TolA-binding protein